MGNQLQGIVILSPLALETTSWLFIMESSPIIRFAFDYRELFSVLTHLMHRKFESIIDLLEVDMPLQYAASV